MRKLIILVLLIGCGAPPSGEEQPNVGEALNDNVTSISNNHNCPSTDTQDTHKLVCPAGKLCPGMSKQEVLAIIGDPTSIEVPYGYPHVDSWDYDADLGVCSDDLWTCTLTFHDELLRSQSKVSIQYIDLTAVWQDKGHL